MSTKKKQEKDLDSRVEEVFAAPEFRKDQKKIIKKIVQSLEADFDCILLDAPTGFGKSLVLETAGRMLSPTFYSTPLNELVDQLTSDEFVADRVIEMKGRSNYDCVHPEDRGTPVNEAICQRDSNFECGIKDEECNYYARKLEAKERPTVVTNLSYLMAENMIPDQVDNKFDKRNLLIVDEVQSLEDFAIQFVGFTISKYSVPSDVWSNIRLPYADSDDKPIELMVDWIKEDVIPVTRDILQSYEKKSSFTSDELSDKEDTQQFLSRITNFVNTFEDRDWVYSIESVVNKNSSNYRKVVFQPVYLQGYLDELLWERADNLILSSATIPKGNWVDEMGLSDKKVGKITVGSNFPVENRPIIEDVDVGKMTYDKREKNMHTMVSRIKDIADFHEGEKGLLHCRGYNMVDMLMRSFRNNGMRDWSKENIFVQKQDERDGSIARWQESDKQIMASVNMAEGIDLEGDKCRWQALVKTKYPNLQDERVSHRVKKNNEWNWYNNKAIIQIEQAYGRAVRSKEDEAAFYILDSSAKSLIKRNDELFHDWFLEAVGVEA